MPAYRILIPPQTLARAAAWLEQYRAGAMQPGHYLGRRLDHGSTAQLTPQGLLGALFDTRLPQIYADSAVVGDGSDWTLAELGLLGDVAVAVPVEVYDDGRHQAPALHVPPLPATLVYVAGALLRNGFGHPPADWAEVVSARGELDLEGLFELYLRRLLPVLHFINQHAATPRAAVVTVPGLGCGQFAGPFHGQLGRALEIVLNRLLDAHGEELPNLRALYYDPFRECHNRRSEHHGVSLLVRPLTAPGNAQRTQLCPPANYADPGEDFSRCALYSLVAWDHVSWPGNDFYLGNRATDDGVKAAATSSMATLTGVRGHYHATLHGYQPPAPFATWKHVVEHEIAAGRLRLWQDEAVWCAP